MPTYDYQCRQCGRTIEVIHSMTEEGPSTCEQCGGQLRRVLYPTGIIFKGSGFYSTDARSSSATRRAKASATGDGSADASKPAEGGPGGSDAPGKTAKETGGAPASGA